MIRRRLVRKSIPFKHKVKVKLHSVSRYHEQKIFFGRNCNMLQIFSLEFLYKCLTFDSSQDLPEDKFSRKVNFVRIF